MFQIIVIILLVCILLALTNIDKNIVDYIYGDKEDV